MKNLQWVITWMIVGIGMATGSMFLLNQVLNSPPEQIIIGLLLIIFGAGIPGVLGYLTIYIFEGIKMLNMHLVIVIPWIIMSLIFVMLAVLKFNIIFNLTVQLPLLLLFSSIGGVMAHQKRINKTAV